MRRPPIARGHGERSWLDRDIWDFFAFAKRAARRAAIKVGDHVTLGAEVALVADHLGLTTVRIHGYLYPVTLELEGKHKESEKIALKGQVARIAEERGRRLVTVRISGADHPVTLYRDDLTKV